MLVEESVSSTPWLYVDAGDTEFLSRCSRSITLELVEAWLTQMQLVRVLLPDDFLTHTDVPTVFVLYAQDSEQTVSAEIERELRENGAGGRHQVDVATSMRLADRDTSASIAYIDETRFEGAGLSVSPEHVGYLLRSRVPELPAWLVEGVERTMRRADFIKEPITLGPLVWSIPDEKAAIANEVAGPRTVLTAKDLFITDAWEPAPNQYPRRIEARAGTRELFVRWGLTSGPATRAAFWKFAARAAERPVTEEVFESCFGFDFAELRDRLSDYLLSAVWDPKRIAPGTLPPLPRLKVERATSSQIARLRGEWERLAIAHVERRLPEAVPAYLAQARRTMHRAYDAGDRDPRLIATMGLCEVDAGNDAGARPFLESAVAAGVVRPRAYYELARLRFAELRRDAPDDKSFSPVELAPVFVPLHRGLQQAPPLSEACALLGQAWSRCNRAPEPGEWVDLETAARLFPRDPSVVIPVARALACHGKKAEATTLLSTCERYVQDENLRTSIARLRAELAGPGAGR
jgi:hypothetical protein